ncbi:hypothetical protein PMIN03_009559 [Paraphaeosphaeria minitans]|uniref:Uncharacterized protein n=1 Tax=Paraphaeosphaeria minitans TaxID=565426 RepID=A0A9P6G951_9PLEO|nr:hypothetical protein PMIN01_11161 [Paraphaeosphaeria minitans]
MMLPKLATLFATVPGAYAFAVPQPNPGKITIPEFTGDIFHARFRTLGVATGPIVTPGGEVYDSTNTSVASTAGNPQQELRITMGTHLLEHVGFTVSCNVGDDL